MPLFPIAEPPADAGGDDLTSNERRLRLESLRPVVASASEGELLFTKMLHRSKNFEFQTFKLQTFPDHDSAYPRGALYLLRCL